MNLDLPLIWAGIIAVAVLLYVMLDGFDLGVGILFPFTRSRADRDGKPARRAQAADYSLSQRRLTEQRAVLLALAHCRKIAPGPQRFFIGRGMRRTATDPVVEARTLICRWRSPFELRDPRRCFLVHVTHAARAGTQPASFRCVF